MNDVGRERRHWDGLRGEGIDINTAGAPPYDVEAVALMIHARLMHWDMKDYWPILDLGCGIGRLTHEMARRLDCNEIWGVDISQNLLDHVPPRDNIKTFLCNGRTLPAALVGDCSSKPLAGAYSVTMFQHTPLEAQESYIFQVAQLLQLGGRFVFTIALGDENVFLSHQVPDRATLDHWCWRAGMEILTVEVQEPTTGWTWVVAAVP